MKRGLIFLWLTILFLSFPNLLWGQCDESDLGYCDSIIVETFDCDHVYDATGDYDSVRVAIYIVHDSNTYYWEGGGKWVQDSIRGVIVPLIWSKEGCADSIVFPTYNNWNNKRLQEGHAQMPRSIFRDIQDTHTSEWTYNRLFAMIKDPYYAEPWNTYISFIADTTAVSAIPMDPACMSWGDSPNDGSSFERVLFATLTFLVYMGDECDTAGICFDSCFWPPNSKFSIIRYEGTDTYVPKHNLSICDTITTTTDVRWIDGGTEEESKPTSFFISQNYPNPFNPVTNFKVSLPKASHVKIEVFNILGQNIRTLVDEDMKAGVFIVDWDGKDEKGMGVSSGVYFYRIIADQFSDIKKMILLR